MFCLLRRISTSHHQYADFWDDSGSPQYSKRYLHKEAFPSAGAAASLVVRSSQLKVVMHVHQKCAVAEMMVSYPTIHILHIIYNI